MKRAKFEERERIMSKDRQMIGESIARRRKELRMTQVELAKRLSVSNKAVSKWETLDSNPDIGLLIPLSEVLEITVDQLLRDEWDSPDEDSSILLLILKNPTRSPKSSHQA